MEKIKLLSLVVPAYKQEKTIIRDLRNLNKALSQLPFNHEIIVVVDGFLDKTLEKAKTARSRDIKVFGYEDNKGKGFALKYGIKEAKGDVIGFIDAGMDISPNSILTLLEQMRIHNADIMIGSKLHPHSNVKYPPIRKILSWGYRNLTRILFGFKTRDTQAGLKFFKRKVAMTVFPKIRVDKFAFDVEVLVLAEQLGFNKIYEGPIELNLKKNTITNLNFFMITMRTFFDTLGIFWRLRVLKRINN